MITTQPAPMIPLWKWYVYVPTQLAVSACFVWFNWWLLVRQDLYKYPPAKRSWYAGAGMAAIAVYTIGSPLLAGYLMDPTHNPKIGVYPYWFLMPQEIVAGIIAFVFVVRRNIISAPPTKKRPRQDTPDRSRRTGDGFTVGEIEPDKPPQKPPSGGTLEDQLE